VSLNQKSSGRGTITFGPTHPWGWMYSGGGWPGANSYASPSFENIENAKHVYTQIREVQMAA
jgi:hypothetical protein